MWKAYGHSDREVLYSETEARKEPLEFIVGESEALTDLKRQILKVGSVDFAVLIQGESGTGKELVARGIHKVSRRRGAPFIAVNSASIPENLLEAELFGCKKGAFTGASSDRTGLIEAAEGGTLFLDEVGELPLHLQAKLLRVLQEREIRRLGENHAKKVNFRLITATNRDLKEMISEGSFREDLYYRIQDLQLRIPPLRERDGDIVILTDYFFRKLEFTPLRVEDSEKIVSWLSGRDFPGNIRELEAVIKRIITFYPDLDFIEGNKISYGGKSLREAREGFEKRYLKRTLSENNGNRTRCAEVLGITREYCWKLIKKYNIEE